jgi:hypothetical protein
MQVLFLKNAILFHTAFGFLYISFILLLPIDMNRLLLLVVGFIMGLMVDIFYESHGMHAFACVLIMYLRNYYLNLITPQGGYDSNVRPTLAMNGLQWFLVYVTPMVFIHHVVLFFLEAGGFEIFWFTLWKAFASTLFTTLLIVLTQFLFPEGKRI